MAAGSGDAYLVGEFELPEGETKVQMSADAPFLADLLVVSDAAGVTGFRFPKKANN